jgi:GH25 family lysozyme M1 (1,4-beta-N-acetylmuramidase)
VSRHLPAAPPPRPARARGTRVAAALALLVGALVTGPGNAALASTPASPSTGGSGAVTADASTGYIEGIDVSHWQNTIDWTKVAAAGKSFAIIKASDGTDFVDDRYLTNRAGAQANGIWTGAYHFARPDATPNDALTEADHFVDTMRLGSGDLIPALDLEQSGGLTIAALQAWVSTFLEEVRVRTGARAMIYTSPAFWKKYMGDSSALADAGYKTLWIAHWNVTSPTVAANNWGGYGWTFWQYSNCGNVSGITGCVDLDRFRGTDLLTSAYSAFSLTATPGQVKQGGAGSSTVKIGRVNFPHEVALDVSGLPDGATAAFVDSPTAGTAAALNVSTATAVPTGTYPLTITGVGDGVTRTTKVNLVVADGIGPTVGAPTMWLEPNALIGSTTIPVYVVWSASDPSGVASTGLQRSVNGSWATVTLPTAAATRAWVSLPIGAKVGGRARATDRLANTSAWVPGPTAGTLLTEQSAGSVRYTGSWRSLARSAAHGGSLKYASAAGASATYTFSGSSVGWVAARGPNRGYARVYVDGAYAGTVNLYASAYQYRRVVFARNFGTAGAHTLKIVVVGSGKHPVVDVDAFIRLYLN